MYGSESRLISSDLQKPIVDAPQRDPVQWYHIIENQIIEDQN
jgi:hypothetical protein